MLQENNIQLHVLVIKLIQKHTFLLFPLLIRFFSSCFKIWIIKHIYLDTFYLKKGRFVLKHWF